MRIRVMHVVDHLGKGGLENGLVNLIEHLDRSRFEHVVYAVRQLGPNADRLTSNGIQVICQGKKGTDSVIQVGALARTIGKIRPDIVHSRNWGAVEAVPAARWFRRCIAVHSEHGLERAVEEKEPLRRNCFRRLVYELAHQVIAVSYQLRDLHARRTGFAVERISVIHNGVDGGRFFPDPAARKRIRSELGIGDGEYCIGCVGNLLPVKDHMTVLKALEALSTNLWNWRLLIIGEGSERPMLERFIAEHADWKPRVSLIGTSHRVPELLRALDVYVLSSIAEGLSNSLLEAMSSGLPVIATATGGNPEVVVDGQSGLLFPVGDFRRLSEQILLLESKHLREELGREARRRVQQEFSIDSMVMKYDHLYRSLGRKTDIPLRAAFGV